MTAPPNELRERFLASARASLQRIAALGRHLEADPGDAGVLDALRREAHRLRGTAGSYGYTGAMPTLAALEDRTAQWAVDPTLESDIRGVRVQRAVKALEPVFDGHAEGDTLSDAPPLMVWCVDPPPSLLAEWHRAADTAGLRFEILNSLQFRERLSRGERPSAVLAPSALGRSLQVPDGLPLVLVSDPRFAAPAVTRSFGAVDVVEPDIAPEDLAIVIARLAERTSMVGGSVVVLDDDPIILMLVRKMCENVGLRTITIDAPALLVPTLAAERPGVLLMDVQMPGTDGFALTRQLRADPEWADLPIVLFSGDTDLAAREAAAAAGADGFLPKPIAPAELQSQLLARVEQVRQQRLAAGLSPATGLPEHERGVRDAERLLGAMRRDGGELSAVVVRPVDLPDEAAWRHCCPRVAQALRAAGAIVAHYDETALVATIREPGAVLIAALDAFQGTSPGSPAWIVGAADASHVHPVQAQELWVAAADAADAARAAGAAQHQWTPADSTRAPDVIIVEDDEALSDLIEFALAREGYTYQSVRTGPEALTLLRTMKVGIAKPLVLLDLDLPGLDGHAIHESLRVERPRDFVVVFISVHAGESDQVRALRAGAADYLIKPLSLRVLMSKLPRWIRQPRGDR